MQLKFDLSRTLSARPLVAIAALIAALSSPLGGQNRRFFDDDPIARVVDTQDASGARRKSVNLFYDEGRNLFGKPGDPDRTKRAQNVNTIDEVPDSTWFNNRIGSRPMTVEEVAKGPDTATGPAPGAWTVTSGKSDGVTPGFTIRDTAGDLWFIKFDPPKYPEMASGAEAAVTKLYHALGYNVPENHVTKLTREGLVINEKSRITSVDGAERRLTPRDIDRLLRMGAQESDGSYRVIASKAVAGKPIGPFLYVGTRSDDPNDVVPHENRRELRALRVFGAWTNHVDSKAINSLDTLVTDSGRAVVRHYLIDFGSTMGSASIKAREYDEGFEYIVDGKATVKNMAGLGFYIPSYHFVDYPDYPSAGNFSADQFDPPKWKPRVPNPAFIRARADDTFWGARRVMAFTDEMIRAAVRTGKYTDAAAEKHIADTLIARRDAIGRAWLTNVNPVISPALDGSGTLTFANPAVDHGVAKPPSAYEVSWHAFDNATGATKPIGAATTSSTPKVAAPQGLPTAAGSFIRADISATGADPEWAKPVHAYFKRTGSGWQLVGFDRTPDLDQKRPNQTSGGR